MTERPPFLAIPDFLVARRTIGGGDAVAATLLLGAATAALIAATLPAPVPTRTSPAACRVSSRLVTTSCPADHGERTTWQPRPYWPNPIEK